MLSLLIAHIIITTFCWWSGFLFYNFFSRENSESKSFIHYAITGLILLTLLTQIIAIFFPVNIYTKLVIIGILVLLSLLKGKKINISIPRIELSASLLLFIIAWAIILLIGSGPVTMDDTESYHIQSIKWIKEFGSVPGLVNLHERFGFNSSWFSSVALFSFQPGSTGGFTVLNSVLSVWLCFWAITEITVHLKRHQNVTSLAFLILLVCSLAIWPLVRGNAATTNYDFITTIVVLILFTDIIKSKELLPSIEWIIWPAYLFTVRIINFPVLLISLFALILFIRQKKLSPLFLSIASCLLLIIPFVIRNIIISGFPFYPAANFDLFNVDWKPDPQLTEKLLEYIKYYNRVSTAYLDIEQTKALGSNWLPSWFKYLFGYDKLLVIAGILGIATSLFTSLSNKSKSAVLVSGASLIWLACWFTISPDPRFIYGILLFGVFMLARQFFKLIKNERAITLPAEILIILLIAFSTFYFFSKSWKEKEYRNWILPATLPQPPAKEISIEGIVFRIPEPVNSNWNPRCYGTELPCLYRIHPALTPRGKTPGEGFRLEK